MKPRGDLKLYPCGAKSFFEEFFIEMHAINDEPLIEGASFHMKPGGERLQSCLFSRGFYRLIIRFGAILNIYEF